MGDMPGPLKVKVLLAQALFGNPDILLLDEPTNHLDLDAINWLEEFLINFENTVIVVSHDRYFLNKVCTNIADIDYGKIQLYAGNYDFWYESSQLLVKQMKEANKKKEEKIKELQDFISRFSANASKSKQATSRKRALEKIQLDEIRPSSRKYPYIDFRPSREIGNEVLSVEGITKTIDGVKVLDNVSFIVGHDDKIAFVGGNELAKTTLFKILTGEMEPDSGSYKWGVTTSQSYFPKDNTEIFDTDLLIVDWLTQYSEIKDATYVRGFLGRMLFAGEDGTKKMRVLSGGEKAHQEDHAIKKFKGISQSIYEDFAAGERLLAFNSPIMQFFMYACMILISWIGAKAVVASGNSAALGMTTGDPDGAVLLRHADFDGADDALHGFCHDHHFPCLCPPHCGRRWRKKRILPTRPARK